MLATIRNTEFRRLLSCWPEQAIRILYESHYDALLIISLRITRDMNASEEIVQQIFTDLWIDHKKQDSPTEPIQLAVVREARAKSFRSYDLHRQVKVLSDVLPGDVQSNLAEINRSGECFNQEHDDLIFLMGNIPELPDIHALDDNFYQGLRQIEYNVNAIRTRNRQVRKILKHITIILVSVMLSMSVFFLTKLSRSQVASFKDAMNILTLERLTCDGLTLKRKQSLEGSTLIFSQASMAHVFKCIEKSFNIEIEMATAAHPEQLFTGTIHTQGGVDDVMKWLGEILTVQVCRESPGLFIVTRGNAPVPAD